MRLLFQDDLCFLENYSQTEKTYARRRIVSMILATDMAHHASHLNVIQNKIRSKNIKKESNNGSLMIDT